MILVALLLAATPPPGKNVKVLTDLTPDQLRATMKTIRQGLGVKCVYCHDVEHKDYASDAKKEKLRGREMFRMNEQIVRTTFNGKPRVSCWTCHRGAAKPDYQMNFPKEAPAAFPRVEDPTKPAEQVFKEIRAFKGVPAGQVGQIMGWFTQELGVKCTFCHAKNDFAASTKKKERAREMLAMVDGIARDYYGGNTPVACGMCHRGKPEPSRPPKESAAGP